MVVVTVVVEVVVVFTVAEAAVSTVVAALSEATTAVAALLAVTGAVDITVVMAATADELATTEVAARTEACAEVPHRGAIPAHTGDGPGRAEVLLGTPCQAGIRLDDQATARGWPAIGGWLAIGAQVEDQALGAWGQPTRRLPTGTGILLEAPAARRDRLSPRAHGMG